MIEFTLSWGHVAGWTGAAVAGLTLGLMGAGGGILTVPVMVFLFGTDPVRASHYALFVVGVASTTGLVSYVKRGNVDFRTVFWFGPTSVLGVIAARRLALPAIPDRVALFGGEVERGDWVLVALAVVMAAAAWSMLRARRNPRRGKKRHPYLIAVEGAGVGLLTGFVGAGGGFMVVPSLVVLGGVPMKTAVGTTLLIVAVKSAIGFLAEPGLTSEVNWAFLLAYTGMAVAGIFVGTRLSKRIPEETLTRSFGWFIVGLAVIIFGTRVLL